jgi:hypothetical protein
MSVLGLQFNRGTLTLYFYTLAVLATGMVLYEFLLGQVGSGFGGPARATFVAAAAALAVPWTLYCEWTVLGRIPGYTKPEE